MQGKLHQIAVGLIVCPQYDSEQVCVKSCLIIGVKEREKKEKKRKAYLRSSRQPIEIIHRLLFRVWPDLRYGLCKCIAIEVHRAIYREDCHRPSLQ